MSLLSATRQAVRAVVSNLRKALKGKVQIETVSGRIMVKPATFGELAPAVAPATPAPLPPVAAPAQPAFASAPARPVVKPAPAASPAAPERPAFGNLCRVVIPLLTVTGPNGQSARVNSSLFAKVLAHMSDGQMYGLDKLRAVGGYANNEAISLAFFTHKAALARLGLCVYADKINARLKVLG